MNIATLISGGVDSAVAVHLLREQGHRPDLFYIRIGMDTDDGMFGILSFYIKLVAFLCFSNPGFL